MRSRLTMRPPARSAMANIRPSTWAGTPESMFLGGCPSQDGQCLRTRSKLPPMPPLERSEEHTSELQSRENLVCRLLLEKKKQIKYHKQPLLIKNIKLSM